MILDIETTGLSPEFAQVILVGIIYCDDTWKITQIFCDHRREEALLLDALKEYIQDRHLIITYNGHAFDIPFLNKRFAYHQVDFCLSMAKHFDLYRVVRASKKALNLTNYKLKTIEEYLGIYRDDQISGKESVDLYNLYESQPTTDLRDKILLHNFDDIKFMIPTLAILDHVPEEITAKYYPYHWQGTYFLTSYQEEASFIQMSMTCEHESRPKVDFRNGFKCVLGDKNLDLTIPIFHIGDHRFIDIDDLPFLELSFNDLDYDGQLALELKDKKHNFHTIMDLRKKHYDL